jgi:RimJ/RimL family protein N-acetyltransferase
MELRPYGPDDLALTEAIECDPLMMAELGGPMRREEIPEIHARRLAHIARGAWLFKIVPDGTDEAAGTVMVWESQWEGLKIHEMGWMILRAHQGRGYAGAAAKRILDRARAERAFPEVHAFPGISNGPSNAICRKSGFELLGPCALEYAGRPLRCNHWRVDLAAEPR